MFGGGVWYSGHCEYIPLSALWRLVLGSFVHGKRKLSIIFSANLTMTGWCIYLFMCCRALFWEHGIGI